MQFTTDFFFFLVASPPIFLIQGIKCKNGVYSYPGSMRADYVNHIKNHCCGVLCAYLQKGLYCVRDMGGHMSLDLVRPAAFYIVRPKIKITLAKYAYSSPFVVAFFSIPFYNFAKYSLEQLLCLRTIFSHGYCARF